jgi:hypothetical protein
MDDETKQDIALFRVALRRRRRRLRRARDNGQGSLGTSGGCESSR